MPRLNVYINDELAQQLAELGHDALNISRVCQLALARELGKKTNNVTGTLVTAGGGLVRAEIDRAIAEDLPGSTVAVVAGRVARRLRDTAPAELDRWVLAHTDMVIAQAIRDIVRSQRGHLRMMAAGKAWAEAAGSVFDALYTVDAQATKLRLGDMTGEHHRFVARHHRAASAANAFLASLHEALAARVGDRRTCEVIDEDQLAAMLRTLGSDPT